MKHQIWMAVLAAGVVGFGLVGCGEKAAEPEPAAPTTTTESGAMNEPAVEAPVAKPDGGMQNASVVDYTNDQGEIVCPVMGTVIKDKTKAVGYQDYEGKRYYFCCDGCPDTFKEDPAKYAKK